MNCVHLLVSVGDSESMFLIHMQKRYVELLPHQRFKHKKSANIFLAVHHAMILGNDQRDAQIPFYVFIFYL